MSFNTSNLHEYRSRLKMQLHPTIDEPFEIEEDTWYGFFP